MNNIYLTINYDLLERQNFIKTLKDNVDTIMDDDKKNAKNMFNMHLDLLKNSNFNYYNALTAYDKNYAFAENVLASHKLSILQSFIDNKINKSLASNSWIELCDLDVELYTCLTCHDFNKANTIINILIHMLHNLNDS